MKCPNCGHENLQLAKTCGKCKADLSLPPAWWPNWRWHIKTLACIYIILTLGYFLLSFLLHRLPPPYDQREIAPEMTPWLNHPKKIAGKSNNSGKTNF